MTASAVADMVHLREEGPNLGGEVGGLTLEEQDGIAVGLGVIVKVVCS